LWFLYYWGDNLNLEDLEKFNKKARKTRRDLLLKSLPLINILIFGAISNFALNWILDKYGFERLIISCTILIAIVIMGQRGR
jgi:uncharacterized membrane protein YwzB